MNISNKYKIIQTIYYGEGKIILLEPVSIGHGADLCPSFAVYGAGDDLPVSRGQLWCRRRTHAVSGIADIRRLRRKLDGGSAGAGCSDSIREA